MVNKAYGGPDERVRYALQLIGLDYQLTDDGDFQLEFALTRERTQIVFIRSETSTIGTLELRKIYACGYTGQEALSPDVNRALLEANHEAAAGAWATFTDDDELFLVFEVKVPADLDAKSLREVLVVVAEYADQAEEQLMGGDAL